MADENQDPILDEIEKIAESEAAVAEPKGGAPDEPADDAGEPAEKPADAESDPAPFVPDDDLVERAVKAGLSMSDAKSFHSKEFAEKIISALETRNQPAPKAGAEGEETPAEAELEVPALPEDEDYDPKLVAAFNGMGRMLKQLAKENAELRKAGQSAAEQSFFDMQYGGLDEGLRAHVDAARKSQLKSKFAMLEAGYKATGAKVERERVFKEAVSLALGDLQAKAGEEKKSAALKQRQGVRLAPPGREPASRRPQSQQDAEAEVISAIERKLASYN